MVETNKILKWYSVLTIVILFNYSLVTGELPITSNVPLQLLISLNLIFVSLYLLFKDNIILSSSEKTMNTTVAITTQYALIYEFLTFVIRSEDHANNYLAIVYLMAVLIHLLLWSSFPQFSHRFISFNFGFATTYVILTLIPLNRYKLILCIFYGGLEALFPSNRNSCIAIIYSFWLYSYILRDGLITLGNILTPSEDEVASLIGLIILCIAFAVIFLTAIILQVRKIKNAAEHGYNAVKDSDVEEGIALPSQADNTSSSNYSTFTN